MTNVDISTGLRAWPGLDGDFQEAVMATAASVRGTSFRRSLAKELRETRGKRWPSGPPVLVRQEYGATLRRFVRSYHSAIETIVDASSKDPGVREVLRLPKELREDVDGDHHPANDRVHLCRLDLLLDVNGGFRVLETNANCPGAVLSCGIASRRWRDYLSSACIEMPKPLNHESVNWMARWFIQTATVATDIAPAFVALFREDGGNRLELPGLARQLADEGVEAVEVDPRELTLSASGVASVRGRRVHHGYWKLGIREFTRMRPTLDAFAAAVRQRTVFVQNGLRGRLIGDNKLCLAILSDPKFERLLDAKDLHVIRNHIPWSRALITCTKQEVERVRSNRAAYVLKRPLDTRGRGVIVGRGLKTQTEWDHALRSAINEGWLVQEFCTTTETRADFRGGLMHRHDLSVGVINGNLAGAFLRSSGELRLNVARTGRLHPVFMET